MPKFLRPRRGGQLTIAICDRCQRKIQLTMLSPDGNSPGLRVCGKCRDAKDPYRYPARQTEKISVRNPRPEQNVPLDTPDFIGTEYDIPIDFPPEINT